MTNWQGPLPNFIPPESAGMTSFQRSCLSPPKSIWTPVDSSPLISHQSPPMKCRSGVEWSPLESTGLDNTCGVHMESLHWKIQLESILLKSVNYCAYLINIQKCPQHELNPGPHRNLNIAVNKPLHLA